MSGQYAYAAPRRWRPLSLTVGLVLGSTVIITIFGLMKAGHGLAPALADNAWGTGPSWRAVESMVWHGLSISILNWWYWAFIAFLTTAQWFWPARRDQRLPSVEMAIDAVWFVMGTALQFTVVAVVLGAVTVAYTEVFGTWSLNLQPEFGYWKLVAFAFVTTDLLAWVTHYCHHKVPTLWRFHAVHHSQERLNALSDNRTHVGEIVCAALMVFIPSYLLGLSATAASTVAYISIFYCAMLHSNVRTNLGPLKYIFMGPQAHRIHHSSLPQHFDSNYATVFSWWDYLGGTRYHGYDEYPPTGISDQDFPLRQHGDTNPIAWVYIFFRQLVYPFQGMMEGAVKKLERHYSPAPRHRAQTHGRHRTAPRHALA